jgi:GH15 family glucan-1,4-alpha-glucosidase
MSQLDFALIGNCQVSALIDTKGQYVWSCMPRLDSPSVFSSLLGGERAGTWSCLPASQPYETTSQYFRNTNVLHTEFRLKNGDSYEIIDFAPRFLGLEGFYRAPQFVRIIRSLKGSPRVRMLLKPKFDYGRLEPEVWNAGDGIVYRTAESRVFLNTDIPQTYLMEGQPFELSGVRYCVLSHGEPFGRPLKFSCEEFLDRTLSYWRTWVKHTSIPFEYQDAVIRSALALKLHVYEDTGAIIAATTTSIPESPLGGRTWDYRYCWLRDAYFVINVLNQLGHFEEMEKFIQFLHNIAVTEPGGELQPVYGIGGERELLERELGWLEGFKGYGPVRVGNAAYAHAQYDAYGEMVLAVTPLFFDSRLDRIDQHRAFENVIQLVERAIIAFEKPDAGIWEFRGERRHYLFSKFMCWAAVDRGLKIAKKLGRIEKFLHWSKAAEVMRTRIETDGWSEEERVYRQAYHNSDADASNLLMTAVNFHAPGNERMRSMVEKYEKTLMKSGYVFRYRSNDDFGVPQHAFTICTFWMVDALVSLGRSEEARVIFERALSCANHVGLLSEDVDPATGELWGNFPQAYSHVGIINSAFRLSNSWNDAF